MVPVGPRLDVPFDELISMVAAMAERAKGKQKAELQQLKERLVAAFGDELGRDEVGKALIDRLLEVDEDVAEAAVMHLVGLCRLRRKSTGRGQRSGSREEAGRLTATRLTRLEPSM